jgi:multidrug efflux pump subunit AcrA (membrane-fusion protein)
MHGSRRRFLPIVILLAVVSAGVYFFLQATANSGGLTVSGTIEATEVNLGSIGGGRVDRVNVQEGELVELNAVVAVVNPGASGRGSSGREMIHTPLAGVVLYRHAEPGEIASAGTPLVTVFDPDQLDLTVYVPEDRYGRIQLGQVLPVTVDSFPGESFQGTVTYIADQAEFTPRNVQTTDNRKTTVFAVRLDLPPSNGKLKPGMPADVHFELQ